METKAQDRALGFRLRLALAATTALAALASPGHAQTVPDAESAVAESELVVTATKRETSIQDVPGAVDAVSAERLSVERVDNIEQLRSIPSFTGDTAFGRDQNRYIVRGVGTYNGNEGTSSAVASYQDETYFDSPSFGSEPFFDLQRIEVLSGPQGTLWGQNSTAGAVNIVTQKPTRILSGHGSLTYGSFNEINAEGAISGPLVENTLFARLSFVRQSRDGWINNTYNNEMIGDYADEAFRGQLLWEPNDKFSALLRVRARDLSGDGAVPWFGVGLLPGNTNVYGYQYPQTYDSLSINVTEPVNELTSRGVSLVVNSDLQFAELMVLASHDEASGESRFDDDASPLDLERFHHKKSAEQQNFEVRLTSPDDRRFSWIAGLSYFHGISGLEQQFYSLQDDPYFVYGYGVRFGQDKSNYGIYGSFTVRLTDAVSLIAGGRYTHEEVEGDIDNVIYRINPISPEELGNSPEPLIPLASLQEKITSSEPTGDLTLQYQPDDKFNFYAKVARGYRGGAFNSAASSQAAAVAVQPEYAWSYEAGARTQWLDRKLTLNATIYRSEFTDLQRNTYVNNVQTLFNAGMAEYTGLDFSADYSPTESLSLSTGLSYVQRKVFGYSASGPDGNIYAVSFDEPYTQANFALTNRWPIAGRGEVSLHTSWNYIGERLLASSLILPADPVWAFMQQDGYWRGDASVAYEPAGQQWRLAGWVKNLTDEQTLQYAIGYPAYGLALATHGDPRTMGVSLEFKF